MIAAAVPTVIEGRNGVAPRQLIEMVVEVFLCTTMTVNEKQAGARTLDPNVELDAVVGPYSHHTPPRSTHHRRRNRGARATFARWSTFGFVGCPSVPDPTPPEATPSAAPAAPATSAPKAARLKMLLRLVVSVGVLTLLVIKTPNLDDVVPHRNHFHTALLLAVALLLTLAGIVLSAWRWQRVLHAFDQHVGLLTLTAYTLAGQFVGNVLPSTIGGDVVRVSRLGAVIDSNETAFASVAIERLTGLVALPALVVFGFLLRPSLLDADHALVALLIATLTVVALAVVLFAAAHPKLAGRFADNQSWTRFIGSVHVGVDRLRRQPREAFGVVGTALVYQLSVVAAVLCIVRTLELPVPTAAVIAFVPAVAMAQVVPISIGGLGVREGMLVLLLHSAFGVKNSQAIAVGLLWYACVLVVSMLGAPAFAVGKRRHPHVAAQASP